jgi:hypothetical protein
MPGDALWVDLLIPAGDPLWRDDIGLATHWVGDVWASVLRRLGPVAGDRFDLTIDARVHTAGMVRTAWSGRACFAGLGPGEVTVGGRKLVGISQRRVRAGARFQTVLLLRSRAADLAQLVPLGVEGAAELDRFSVGLDELLGRPGEARRADAGAGGVDAEARDLDAGVPELRGLDTGAGVDAAAVWALLLDELGRR